jgi:TIR domain
MDGSTPAAPGRIFISYRRQETAYPAAWLYERVVARFGRDQVFKDVDSIVLGDDFAEVIAGAVGSCDVLLALMGDRWLTITDEDGRRRLDDPGDFVRLEIETALERNIRVIPVLFEGARLPRATDLPSSLAKLVRRQALELTPSRFDADIGKLLSVLDTTLAEEQARREQAARAAREAEEQARREAEARAAREAEEQALREAEERRLGAIDTVAQELRSGNPSAVASAEGALRRLATDANPRVAQTATSVLANWQAEANAQREAESEQTSVIAPSSVAAKPPRRADEKQGSIRVRSPSDDSKEGTTMLWLAVAAGVFLILIVSAVIVADRETGGGSSGTTITAGSGSSETTATTDSGSAATSSDEKRTPVFSAKSPWRVEVSGASCLVSVNLADGSEDWLHYGEDGYTIQVRTSGRFYLSRDVEGASGCTAVRKSGRGPLGTLPLELNKEPVSPVFRSPGSLLITSELNPDHRDEECYIDVYDSRDGSQITGKRAKSIRMRVEASGEVWVEHQSVWCTTRIRQ